MRCGGSIALVYTTSKGCCWTMSNRRFLTQSPESLWLLRNNDSFSLFLSLSLSISLSLSLSHPHTHTPTHSHTLTLSPFYLHLHLSLSLHLSPFPNDHVTMALTSGTHLHTVRHVTSLADGTPPYTHARALMTFVSDAIPEIESDTSVSNIEPSVSDSIL